MARSTVCWSCGVVARGIVVGSPARAGRVRQSPRRTQASEDVLVVVSRARLPEVFQFPRLVLARLDVRPPLDAGRVAQPLEPGVRACPSPEEDRVTRTRFGWHEPLEVGVHDRVHWAVERL